jgi:hypothetical protein
VPNWDDAGFPIAEVRADGSFVLTKPDGTGGLVTPLTAGEQMLYELGDPAAYVLPDVVADFSRVTMKQEADNRVLIQGARGRAPTPTYKVSATYLGGFGCVGTMVFAGRDAVRKARRHGEAVLKKTQRIVEQAGLGGFAKTELQLVGSESAYGANARAEARNTREVVLRLGVHHRSRDAAEIFSKEFTGAALSMAPGLTGLSPGRPRTAPIVQLYSFLIDKRDVPVSVAVDGKPVAFEQTATVGTGIPTPSNAVIPAEAGIQKQSASLDARFAAQEVRIPRERMDARSGRGHDGETSEQTVPLHRLAVARSGDKGDSANIGVIARKPEYLPAIRAALTTEAVARYFAHVAHGRVERFDLPGIHALNFILYESLGGGGIASLNLDAQGKTYAQQLLDLPIPVPAGLIED